MGEPASTRPWVARVGFLIGVVVLAGLVWWATGDIQMVIGFLCPVCCIPSMYEFWSSRRRGKPALGLHSFRVSIWQIMAGSGLVAVYLGLVRAVFTAFPIADNRIVLMLSVTGLFVYAMFCFLAYQIWVSVRNIRAVLRGERLRYPGRDRFANDRQPKG